MERAVGQNDAVAVQARFETVGCQHPQRGFPGLTVAGGTARCFAELPTELVGALVKDCPRRVAGAFGVLECAGKQPPGELVTALGQ